MFSSYVWEKLDSIWVTWGGPNLRLANESNGDWFRNMAPNQGVKPQFAVLFGKEKFSLPCG